MQLIYNQMFNAPKTKIQITEKDVQHNLERLRTIITQLNQGQGDNKDGAVPMIGWQNYAQNIKRGLLEQIASAAHKLKRKCELIFVIGIGGSYLGPRAVIEALYGKNYNEIFNPKIYFLGCDTDPDYYQYILRQAEGKSIGAVVISKSGTTTEPALAFRYIKELIERQHGTDAKERIIAVTDECNGALRKMAFQAEWQTFVIPEDIGGRFSVVTPVGLVPMAMAGVDIVNYLKGYTQAKPLVDSENIEKNPAAMYALLRFLAWQKGAVAEYQITNSSAFEANIFWTMQMEPESEGHKGHGLHVVPGVFPRDLHSIGQLIQQGPRNLIEIATKIMKPKQDLEVPLFPADLDGLNYIPKNNLTLNDINKMTIDGPLAAHYADGVPNMTIELEEITPTNLGKYHYMLMKATAIQGYLLGHNPFIQPGVQLWKDKLFTMAGKPGYEKQHEQYKTEAAKKAEKNIITF
ncbi:Glucose-6-phosphate isomerase [sediment metagenome]|uniref:glucose-6-phosphate isomerase n=1 Tax=sediment metagenome TaxID=749907 RepID=D9PMB7_9ZZZZ